MSKLNGLGKTHSLFHYAQIIWKNSDIKWMKVPSFSLTVTKYLTFPLTKDDSRKRYRGLWAEVGKYWPGNEPIRLQDSLPCPLKKNNAKYWLSLQEICISHNRMVLRTHYEKKKSSLIGQINFSFQQMIFCTLTCLNCVWSGSEIKSNQILRLKKK